jgi:hypothetical protein
MVFLQSKSALCANYKEPGKQETSHWARSQRRLQPSHGASPLSGAFSRDANAQSKAQAQDWQGFGRSPAPGRVRQPYPETCAIPAKLIE